MKKPSDKVTTAVYIPKGWIKQLRKIANQEERSVNYVMAKFIEIGLSQMQRGNSLDDLCEKGDRI